MENCPSCRNENNWCLLHQKADIAYEKVSTGDIQKELDPRYMDLQEKYNEGE